MFEKHEQSEARPTAQASRAMKSGWIVNGCMAAVPRTACEGMSISSGNERLIRKDGIQYTGSTIDFIQTEEGIIRNNSGTYSYEYNLKDHLGNTRVTFYKNPSTGLAEAIQQDNYYPFGMQKIEASGTNKYLYNGKEKQDD